MYSLAGICQLTHEIRKHFVDFAIKKRDLHDEKEKADAGDDDQHRKCSAKDGEKKQNDLIIVLDGGGDDDGKGADVMNVDDAADHGLMKAIGYQVSFDRAKPSSSSSGSSAAPRQADASTGPDEPFCTSPDNGGGGEKAGSGSRTSNSKTTGLPRTARFSEAFQEWVIDHRRVSLATANSYTTNVFRMIGSIKAAAIVPNQGSYVDRRE